MDIQFWLSQINCGFRLPDFYYFISTGSVHALPGQTLPLGMLLVFQETTFPNRWIQER